MEEKDEFIDGESFYSSGKGEITFKDIVMLHLKRITTLCCVEWHGGYWQNKVSQGKLEKYYVQDSKECFNNAVLCLYDILTPHIDETSMEKVEKIYNDLLLVNPSSKKEALFIVRRLFRELCKFLKKIDYFNVQTY